MTTEPFTGSGQGQPILIGTDGHSPIYLNPFFPGDRDCLYIGDGGHKSHNALQQMAIHTVLDNIKRMESMIVVDTNSAILSDTILKASESGYQTALIWLSDDTDNHSDIKLNLPTETIDLIPEYGLFSNLGVMKYIYGFPAGIYANEFFVNMDKRMSALVNGLVTETMGKEEFIKAVAASPDTDQVSYEIALTVLLSVTIYSLYADHIINYGMNEEYAPTLKDIVDWLESHSVDEVSIRATELVDLTPYSYIWDKLQAYNELWQNFNDIRRKNKEKFYEYGKMVFSKAKDILKASYIPHPAAPQEEGLKAKDQTLTNMAREKVNSCCQTSETLIKGLPYPYLGASTFLKPTVLYIIANKKDRLSSAFYLSSLLWQTEDNIRQYKKNGFYPLSLNLIINNLQDIGNVSALGVMEGSSSWLRKTFLTSSIEHNTMSLIGQEDPKDCLHPHFKAFIGNNIDNDAFKQFRDICPESLMNELESSNEIKKKLAEGQMISMAGGRIRMLSLPPTN
jgi:hypothetical protein